MISFFHGMTYNLRGFRLGFKTVSLLILGLIRFAVIIGDHHSCCSSNCGQLSGDPQPDVATAGKCVHRLAMAPGLLAPGAVAHRHIGIDRLFAGPDIIQRHYHG